MHPQAVQGLSGSALVKALAPDVERFLLTASLEKYRSQIEADERLAAGVVNGARCV